MGLCALLSVSLGLMASACANKSSGALVAGYILNAMAFIGVMFLLVVVTESFHFHIGNSQSLVASASPIFAYLESFRPSMVDSGRPHTWPFGSFGLLTWLRGAFFYLTLAFLAHMAAMNFFKRRYMRRP